MRCLNCNCEVESDDNFCPNCGHWTPRGYKELRKDENVKSLIAGTEIAKNNRMSTLFSILFIGIILFVVMLIVRGNNLFKPIIYIKKKIDSYNYGYNISIMQSNNDYHSITINNIEDAYKIIQDDYNNQRWKCLQDTSVYRLEQKIAQDYLITSVDFCDIPATEAKKIEEVIAKMYSLFPNMAGGLTNITISNAATKSEYIAYFQPMYQFVNSNEDINEYNKVNKTQILLNSYYFLNEDIISKNLSEVIDKDWYVNDATWESTIAHELGHYAAFKAFLKENGLDNITLITNSNEEIINEIMKEYDSGLFANNILNEALQNYNGANNENITIDEYTERISKYASIKDSNGSLIADETIAEAVHDYYLHEDNCKKESIEIINILKKKL